MSGVRVPPPLPTVQLAYHLPPQFAGDHAETAAKRSSNRVKSAAAIASIAPKLSLETSGAPYRGRNRFPFGYVKFLIGGFPMNWTICVLVVVATVAGVQVTKEQVRSVSPTVAYNAAMGVASGAGDVLRRVGFSR